MVRNLGGGQSGAGHYQPHRLCVVKEAEVNQSPLIDSGVSVLSLQTHVAAGVASIFSIWVSHGYDHVGNFTAMVLLLYVATVAGSVATSLLHVHLIKRA
jgi:hypothetical protein